MSDQQDSIANLLQIPDAHHALIAEDMPSIRARLALIRRFKVEVDVGKKKPKVVSSTIPCEC